MPEYFVIMKLSEPCASASRSRAGSECRIENLGMISPRLAWSLLLLGLLAGAPASLVAELMPLAEIRTLSREELAANPPVKVRATVTRARRH